MNFLTDSFVSIKDMVHEKITGVPPITRGVMKYMKWDHWTNENGEKLCFLLVGTEDGFSVFAVHRREQSRQQARNTNKRDSSISLPHIKSDEKTVFTKVLPKMHKLDFPITCATVMAKSSLSTSPVVAVGPESGVNQFNDRALQFYSTDSGSCEFVKRFKQRLYDVLSSTSCCCVVLENVIIGLDPNDLSETLFSTQRDPYRPGGVQALGNSRWLAFSTTQAKEITRTETRAEQALNLGIKLFSEYVGRTSEPVLDLDKQPLGNIIVQDVLTEGLVAHFTAHQSAISVMKWDPSGTLLATAGETGKNIHVYSLINQHPHQIYNFFRGHTRAVISDITFTNDSKLLLVSTTNLTTHIFGINRNGGPLRLDLRETRAMYMNFDKSSPANKNYNVITRISHDDIKRVKNGRVVCSTVGIELDQAEREKTPFLFRLLVMSHDCLVEYELSVDASSLRPEEKSDEFSAPKFNIVKKQVVGNAALLGCETSKLPVSQKKVPSSGPKEWMKNYPFRTYQSDEVCAWSSNLVFRQYTRSVSRSDFWGHLLFENVEKGQVINADLADAWQQKLPSVVKCASIGNALSLELNDGLCLGDSPLVDNKLSEMMENEKNPEYFALKENIDT